MLPPFREPIMRFFIKTTEPPMPDTRQSIFDSSTGSFYDFVGGVLDTDVPETIERLTELGYESVADGKNETFKCGECDFIAKSAAGKSAHSRSHKEKQ